MLDKKDILKFAKRVDFRKWLQKNYDKVDFIWIQISKKHIKSGLKYEDAVEEALCFGWIDGQIQRIDDDYFMQRYSPRKSESIWSKVNKDRVEKLIKEKKMTSAGLKAVKIAKIKGEWQKAYTSQKKVVIPADFKKELAKNKKAWEFFQSFPIGGKNNYIDWIGMAKQEKNRQNRIKKSIEKLAKNMKLFDVDTG